MTIAYELKEKESYKTKAYNPYTKKENYCYMYPKNTAIFLRAKPIALDDVSDDLLLWWYEKGIYTSKYAHDNKYIINLDKKFALDDRAKRILAAELYKFYHKKKNHIYCVIEFSEI